MSITIVYGSDSGVTRKIANKLAAKCGAKALDIKKASTSDFENCSLLILGCPTYADGELQSDWVEHLGKLEEANLTGKKIAIFGMGDQINYPSSFVDAIGILYDVVIGKGATVVGFTEPNGFDYSESKALRDGKFVGLALDEDNQAAKTDARIGAWLAQIK
jgi:flavodoxin I